MKSTLKTSFLLIVCSLALVLSGCGEEENKVDLPGQAASAKEKSAESTSPSDDDEAGQDGGDEAAQQAGQQTPDEQPPAAQAAAEPADQRRLSGSFEPQRTSSVAANVGGIIREVYVDEGDVVEEGDRLLDIDPQDYQLRVAEAQAAVEAAEAQVDTLETEYNRTARLLEQEAVPQSQFDQLSGNLAGARAQLEQAKVGLRMAQKARADAAIEAPFTGVVTAVNVDEGNYAAPGPSPLVQIDQVQNLYLRVRVPEEYAGDVQQGDMLTVQVPSLERTMRLPVSRINPTVAQGSRSFDVLAEVDNSNLEIRSGMFAEVTLADNAAGGGPVEEPDASSDASSDSQGGER